MPAIRVTPQATSRYRVAVGRHDLTVDQPVAAGGDDRGPTPVELFAASITACIAYYAGSYLTRHGHSTDGLVVDGDFVMANDSPARVVSVSVTITPPVGLSPSRTAGLLAVASHCTVQNTLRQPPTVQIGVAEHLTPTATDYVAASPAGNGGMRRSTAVATDRPRSSSSPQSQPSAARKEGR
jgi:uncharacterized OsmC-like protein